MSISIEKFYENATILVTGGTGFLGKVLIEKLLSTFKVRKIYLLIRQKNGQNIQQRLEELLQQTVFGNIHAKDKDLLKKVHAISANFNVDNMGITIEDQRQLCAEVEIVFNVVASVKFNERLSDAIQINVIGTKKTLDLAMKFHCLKSFLHVSSLFSNCNRSCIKERVYESPIGYEHMIQLCRTEHSDNLEKKRQQLIGNMPNTYTITKNCAENLVNHRALFMAAGIFRPAIIISTYKDPFPGWTDNLYGPAGICTYTAMGVVHCICGVSHCKANLVPADYCINAMLASAWDIFQRHAKQYETNKSELLEIPVYNFISQSNNITWGQYMHLARKGFYKPFRKVSWCFAYIIIPWKPVFSVLSFILHGIPAYLLDFISWMRNKSRKHIRRYKQLSKILEMMSWFGMKDWKFTHANMDELKHKLTEHEKQILPFDIDTIDWSEYFLHYLSGVRHYFFQENDADINKTIRIYRSLFLMHMLMKIMLGYKLSLFILRLYLGLTRKIDYFALYGKLLGIIVYFNN